MSTNKDGLELQHITTEEPSKPASERASDTESATSKEPENQEKGWKIFKWLRNNGLKLGEKTSKFKGLKAISLIRNNSVTCRNLLVAAATGGLEHLLNAKAFNCPENNYRLYGYTFLFGPIAILFFVNVLVIGEIWKLTSRRYIRRYHRRGDVIARLIPSLLKACVGPAVWLIVAFLEEDYYLCAKLGPFPSNGNETSELEINEMEKKIKEEKSYSHVWAWIVLVALVVCGTVVVVCKHCFVKDNILMHNNFEYERREALGAMKRFTELINSGAKHKDRGPDDDPESADKTLNTKAKHEDTDPHDDPVIAEYGGQGMKIKYYKDGVPEKIGRETVDKLFEGADDWKCGDEWHYIKAFEAFKRMYPRISTGSPLDPWRAVQGDNKGNQKKTKNPWEVRDLRPLNFLEAGHDQANTK
ncbi:hypothetical protein ACROYT_G023433 [Oculina patagonica]